MFIFRLTFSTLSCYFEWICLVDALFHGLICYLLLLAKSPDACPPVTHRGYPSRFSCYYYWWRVQQATHYSCVNIYIMWFYYYFTLFILYDSFVFVWHFTVTWGMHMDWASTTTLWNHRKMQRVKSRTEISSHICGFSYSRLTLDGETEDRWLS